MLNLLVWIGGIATMGCIAAWLATNPGSLTFFWLGWRVDTSVGVLLALLAALCLVATALTLMINALIRVPRRVRRLRRQRSYVLGLRAATGSLVALATGDVPAARRFAVQTQRHLPDTPLALLIAAQTARAEGNDAELHRSLEAMLAHKETRFLAARGLTDRFTLRGDNEAALAYAEQARDLNPRDAAAAEAVAGLYARQSRWREAERALRGPQKTRLKGIIALAKAEQMEEEGNEKAARRAARKAAGSLPGFAPAPALAAKLLAAQGQDRAARRLIKRAWKRAPSPLLADALLDLLQDTSPKAALKIARRIAGQHPDHAESQLLIARVALKARDWQAVREALGLALSKEETTEACRLMATLEREGYGDELAAERWEKRAGFALEGRWECENCGHPEPVWLAHCPQCRAFGKAEWVMARKSAPGQTVMSVAG